MNFNNHYNLEGKHAFLGASKYSWINYDDQKLIATYNNMLAVEHGTRMHELARMLIEEGVKLKSSKKTFNCYVNDAIGYRMTPEQVLYYSDNCFGTADAISFKNNFLRIHDLKTGVTPASMKQLLIYTALFCLEYDFKPSDFDAELRIYQNDEIIVYQPTVDDIVPIMDRIVSADKILDKIQAEMGDI